MTAWIIFLFAFIAAQIFVWKLSFFKTPKLPKWSANLILAAKVAGGIALFFIYSKHYGNRETADVFKFFDDAKTIHSIIHENREAGMKILFGFTDESTAKYETYMCSWQRMMNDSLINENRLIIRLNALFLFFSFGNYFIHVLIFSFLSFLGSWFLILALSEYLSGRNARIFLLVLLLPSVTLWTSGLLKESLLNFAVGLVIWEYLKNPKRLLALFAIILGSFILLFTRTIIGLIFLLSFISFLLASKQIANQKILLRYSSVFAVVLLIAVALSQFHERFDYFKIIAQKQELLYREASHYKASSLVDVPRVSEQPQSLIFNLPLGFAYGLIQPTPFQADGNKLILLSGIENMFVLMFMFFLLTQMRKPEGKRAQIFWLLISAAVIYLSFIGLLIPVLGNLVRYKAICVTLIFAGVLLVQRGNEKQSHLHSEETF
jgi:hypothetical protein